MEKILNTPSEAMDEALMQTEYKEFSALIVAYKDYRRAAGFVENLNPAIKPRPIYGIWYDPRPEWKALKAEIMEKKNSGDYGEAMDLFKKVNTEEWPANEEVRREIEALKAEIAELAGKSE